MYPTSECQTFKEKLGDCVKEDNTIAMWPKNKDYIRGKVDDIVNFITFKHSIG